MWRMDNVYAARGPENGLKRKPSQYVKDHIWFTTQPLDYPENKLELTKAVEWMEAEKILLFSSDYPHWTLILQLVRRAGAGETLVVETSRLRRDVARACGAAQAIGPGDGPGGDRLYDVVFDCTGTADAFAASLALVVPRRPGRGARLLSVADLAAGNRP
jgi:hypothetical protein